MSPDEGGCRKGTVIAWVPETEHKNTPLQGGAFLLYDVGQGFRCALIVARHYVAVGVERQIGSAVAEALLNRLVAGSVLQQERGAGVAQAVEAEILWLICFLP